MKVKALLTTHEEIAVSPTEPQPYNKVNPRMVKENINAPIAEVVSKMISDQGKEAAMRTTIMFSNDIKVHPDQKAAVLDVSKKELGYIEQEKSFEEKLAERLKNGKGQKITEEAPTISKKNKMSPN